MNGMQRLKTTVANDSNIAYLEGMRTWLFIVLLLPFFVQAEIYRWVDSDGKVHYSDQPAKGASKVRLPGISTYKSKPYKKITPGKPKPKPADQTYRVRIVKPQEKETVRSNEGEIEVEVDVSPDLNVRRGHRLIISLDGKTHIATTSKYKLTGVDRGTHVIAVQVFSSTGRVLSSSTSVTVHLRKHSSLHRNAPPKGSLIKRAPQAPKAPTPPPPPATKPGYKP
jgi:hypothetical protein